MNDAYKEFVDNRNPTDYPLFENFTVGEIFHAVTGMSCEANEALDVLKAWLAYGKEPDWVNLDEEVGDILWFIQLYCNSRGLTYADLIAMNVAKLEKRYPNGFSYHEALNRDLGQERVALETASESEAN